MNAWRRVCGPIFLACPAGDPVDDPPGAVPVQKITAGCSEDRSLAPFADRQVDRTRRPRGERDHHALAALAGNRQRPMAALGTEHLNVGSGGLRDPQPVQRQQRDKRVFRRAAKPVGNEQRADLVAVQAGGVALAVQAGPSNVGGRGMVEQVLFHGVLVQPCDGGQPPGDRGSGTTGVLQLAGEQLDVGPADREQVSHEQPGRILPGYRCRA